MGSLDAIVLQLGDQLEEDDDIMDDEVEDHMRQPEDEDLPMFEESKTE